MTQTLATPPNPAFADLDLSAIQSVPIEYHDGETRLVGQLCFDPRITQPRPGMLVAPEWWGLTGHAKTRAAMLAALGYVALALDMYGEGRIATNPADAQEWMNQLVNDVPAWQQRARTGLDTLVRQARVDGSRLGAIGFCFGGATVLQLAYSGAALKGVVSFHGSLPVPTPEQQQALRARILIAHGAADPLMPAERLSAFQQALEASGADWQMMTYGHTRHAFTNPDADSHGMAALAYSPGADARSWALMQGFLEDLFRE